MGVSRQEKTLAAAALVESLQPDAPIGFAVHDEELRYVLISDSLAAVHGRPAAEHVGRRPSDVLHPAYGRRAEELLGRVRDSGKPLPVSEFDSLGPGRRRTWVANVYPMEVAGRRWVGAAVVDVTERRRADEELRDSERLLSGAQEMAALGWWIWQRDPETIVYAPELLALMGRDPSLGGTPQLRDRLELADAEEMARVRAAGRAAMREDRPFAARIRARRADGEIRLLDARADPVHDADGRPIALRGFAQDITDLAEQRQRTVADLGQAALAGVELEELMQRAVDVFCTEPGVDGAGVLELTPDGELAARARSAMDGFTGPWRFPVPSGAPAERALATRQPVILDDLDPETQVSGFGARSAIIVVIGGRGRPFGLIGAMSRRAGSFGRDHAVHLQALANVIADAVERRTAEAEVAELSAARGRLVGQALDAEERTRRRISETLHDGALQELLAARVELFALAGRGGDEEALAGAQEHLGAVVKRLREVMSALHPTVLQYGGLEAALSAVADEQGGSGGFETQVQVDPQAAGLRDDLLLSVARELLANVARHAAASSARVVLRREDDDLVLDVADDGSGADPQRLERAVAEGRIGLASCRERMEAVGGSLVVEPAAGGGLHVRARAPAGDATGRSARAPAHAGPPDRE